MGHIQTSNDFNFATGSGPINRLRTFVRYPREAAKSALILAENGFVYIGTGASDDDTVQCEFCGVKYKGWRLRDNVSNVHRNLSPKCFIFTGSYNGNVLFESEQNHKNENEVLDSSFSVDSVTSSNSYDDIETDSAIMIDSGISIDDNGDLQQSQRTPASDLEIEQDLVPLPTGAFFPNTNHLISEASVQSPSTESSPATVSSSALPPVESATVQETRTASSSASGSQSIHQQPQHTSDPSSPSNASSINSSQAANSSSQSRDHNSNTLAHQSSSMNTSNSAPPPPPPPSSSSSSSPPEPHQGLNFAELGIITETAKRPEFSDIEKRRQSFHLQIWPRDHHIATDDLVVAGFYYAGYGDCTRCFFCGGGLRNWEKDDNVFVEHVRWFPKCGFMKKTMVPEFIKAVKDLHSCRQDEEITLRDVLEKAGLPETAISRDSAYHFLKDDPAVLAVTSEGFNKSKVITAAMAIVSDEGGSLCAETLLKKMLNNKQCIQQALQRTDNNGTYSTEEINKLKDKISDLRKQRICRVCLSGHLSVLFLPCGHLACCSNCAGRLTHCPICRNFIRGSVRVSLS